MASKQSYILDEEGEEMKRVVIGQAGGPTAVINNSLAGFLENIADAECYAIDCGFEGLVKNRIRFIDSRLNQHILQNRHTPGAILGSGRYHVSEEDFKKIITNLKDTGIDSVVMAGGNGTMWALSRLSEHARAAGYDLQVLGIPKTVDNDLGMTDHSPGFPSAAKYVGFSTRDMISDLESMRNFEKIRIVETMGRYGGWLAAAARLFHPITRKDSPLLVYIPEKHLTREMFLEDIDKTLKKHGVAFVVVSEGVKLGDQEVVKTSSNGRNILGGIATILAKEAENHFQVMARDECLGMNQRSFSLSVSSVDREESYQSGKEAAIRLLKDESDKMICIGREENNTYKARYLGVSLKEVAEAGERRMPEEFTRDPEAYIEWLKPLISY
ncbi:diphosphate--fructose-6-phosphate 1-phosphotransferase [Thalassobacillus devorans]|uniref:diphosphate--fructose-6-phosphate 1-phosphotransferase n=1 Tax=Thalassobacillus devorans TaxID=279813 RepID=UPI0007830F33|nr:diphosphate--fructose-6-phosphate 1-phosphotransferase [Thalassobacillus devorans]